MCHNGPEADRNRADAESINPIPVYFWHVYRIIIFNIITLKVYSGRPFKRGGVIQGLSLLRPICQVTLSFMNEMYVASCRWGGGICVLYHYSVWRYLLFYCDTPKPAILRPIRIEITIRKVCAQNSGSGVFTRRKPGVFHAVAYKILHFFCIFVIKNSPRTFPPPTANQPTIRLNFRPPNPVAFFRTMWMVYIKRTIFRSVVDYNFNTRRPKLNELQYLCSMMAPWHGKFFPLAKG